MGWVDSSSLLLSASYGSHSSSCHWSSQLLVLPISLWMSPSSSASQDMRSGLIQTHLIFIVLFKKKSYLPLLSSGFPFCQQQLTLIALLFIDFFIELWSKNCFLFVFFFLCFDVISYITFSLCFFHSLCSP